MAQAMTHQDTRNRDNDTNNTGREARTRPETQTREHSVVDNNLARRRYGGFSFASAFFGWLVATGMGAILVSLLAAAGSAVALTAVDQVTSETASTVGLASGILLVLTMMIAYYAGGYVAGRMARFDGARQGFGVWGIGFLLALILGGLGAALGSKYNVVQQLNLPHLPIDQGSFTTGGLITSLALLLLTLLAAILGGKLGERYHRRVDQAAEVGTVQR